MQTGFAVARLIDGMPLLAQAFGHEGAGSGIIVNDKHSHERPSKPLRRNDQSGLELISPQDNAKVARL
ncbi:hypothetical protein GCM10009434_25330 [Brevundimonas olei]